MSEESVDFDPFSQTESVPHDLFARLRAECPVARVPVGWYLSKLDDVVAASRNTDVFVASFRAPGVVVPDEEKFISEISEPRHGRVRRVVNGLLRNLEQPTEQFGPAMCPGEKVIFGLASANRDEAHFAAPDEFRIGRENARDHVAFGAGPHVCPCASLARLEARVALETFVELVDEVEPAPGWVPRKTPVFFANGPVDLLVRFAGPSASPR